MSALDTITPEPRSACDSRDVREGPRPPEATDRHRAAEHGEPDGRGALGSSPLVVEEQATPVGGGAFSQRGAGGQQSECDETERDASRPTRRQLSWVRLVVPWWLGQRRGHRQPDADNRDRAGADVDPHRQPGRRGDGAEPRAAEAADAERGRGTSASAAGRSAPRLRGRTRSIATSQMPNVAPATNSVAASMGIDGASTASRNAVEHTAIATTSTRRAPKRSHNRPVVGIEISDPRAMHSNATPSCGSVASSRSRTAGIRDTHVAISSPLAANTA